MNTFAKVKQMMMMLNEAKISVIGLGYVGLPLALEFSKQFPVVGYDISKRRIEELRNGQDHTLESTPEEVAENLKKELNLFEKGFYPTFQPDDIKGCDVYIVTVPTPIDQSKRPDLTPLESASKMIGSILKVNDVVIYESTTFPGCTEEVCVPILEKTSGLKYNADFFVGYSPERINPGDKVNTLTKIKKVTSGSTPEAADFVDSLYSKIIEAGTFKASSLKVAEASKAIENAQRDVNISFINELAIIFEKLGIDTYDVLEAAGTKWNFLKYKPGLVGGHCIGVDPYYLAYKAERAGYLPNVILSGRRVNDNMGSFIANKVVKLMIKKGISILKAKVLILGITFKENCPDTRNTKVVDIIAELREFGCEITVVDPWADKKEVYEEFGIHIQNSLDGINKTHFDTVVLAVAHDQFKTLNFNNLKTDKTVIYDCKGIIDRGLVDARL